MSNTSIPAEKMREIVSEELKRIPRGVYPQNIFRAVYQMNRMRSLGRKADGVQTATQVLRSSLDSMKIDYPEFPFAYDELFFNLSEDSDVSPK